MKKATKTAPRRMVIDAVLKAVVAVARVKAKDLVVTSGLVTVKGVMYKLNFVWLNRHEMRVPVSKLSVDDRWVAIDEFRVYRFADNTFRLVTGGCNGKPEYRRTQRKDREVRRD